MKKVALCLSLICCTIAAWGQKDNSKPGYIILNGDTIHGFIQPMMDITAATVCKFKREVTANWSELKPDSIDGYGYTGSRYASHTVTINESEEQVFLEKLVDAEVGLFYYKYKLPDGSDYQINYYIQKDGTLYDLIKERKRVTRLEDGDIVQNQQYYKERLVENNKYKGTLNYLFSDCPEVQAKVENLNFSRKGLVNIVTKYNECKGHKIRDFSKKPIKALYGAQVGAFTSGIDYFDSPRYDITFDNHNSLHFAVFYEFFLRSSANKLSVRFELGYLQDYFESSTQFSESLFDYDYYAELQATYIRTPITLNYNLHTKNSSVVFGAGLMHALVIEDINRQILTSYDNNGQLVNQVEREALVKFTGHEFGMTFRVARPFNIGGMILTPEIRVDRTKGFSGTHVKTDMTRYGLILSLAL
ncbi:MAG: hypothetical protein R3345_00695 [Fulvivirga sp.]|nr:hypothetical protein [Fulvivirga sp.]